MHTMATAGVTSSNTKRCLAFKLSGLKELYCQMTKMVDDM